MYTCSFYSVDKKPMQETLHQRLWLNFITIYNKISKKSKKVNKAIWRFTFHSVQQCGCRSPCPATYVFCLTFIPKPGPDMLDTKVLTRLDIYLKRKKGKLWPTSFKKYHQPFDSGCNITDKPLHCTIVCFIGVTEVANYANVWFLRLCLKVVLPFMIGRKLIYHHSNNVLQGEFQHVLLSGFPF